MLTVDALACLTNDYCRARARWSARPAEVRARLVAVAKAGAVLADVLGDLRPIDREVAGIPAATAGEGLDQVDHVTALARDAAEDLRRRIGRGGRRGLHHLLGESPPRFAAVVAVREAYRRMGMEPTTAQIREAAVEVFDAAGDANPCQGVDDLIRRLSVRKNHAQIELVPFCHNALEDGIVLDAN